MKSVKVLLNDIEKVKEFVHLIEKSENSCEIGDGNYFVDARSIIGIFSLDTSKQLELKFSDEKESTLLAAIDKFVIK